LRKHLKGFSVTLEPSKLPKIQRNLMTEPTLALIIELVPTKNSIKTSMDMY